jgi:hypothetical protein
MPMNPRLLRPTQGGFISPDADARAYLAAVRIADGSNLEPAVAKAISDFVVGTKADGTWSLITASCILMGAKTLNGALVPLKGPTPTGINLAAGDYNRETGIKGNGVDKAINTNRAGNADGQNSLHFAVYISEAHTGAANGAYIASGNLNQTSASGLFRGGGLGSHTYRIRGQSIANATTPPGAFAGVRVDSTTAVLYGDSAATNTSATSVTAAATNWWVLGNNSTGTTNQFPCDGRVAFYSVGAAISSNSLLTRIATLYAAIGAAL